MIRLNFLFINPIFQYKTKLKIKNKKLKIENSKMNLSSSNFETKKSLLLDEITRLIENCERAGNPRSGHYLECEVRRGELSWTWEKLDKIREKLSNVENAEQLVNIWFDENMKRIEQANSNILLAEGGDLLDIFALGGCRNEWKIKNRDVLMACSVVDDFRQKLTTLADETLKTIVENLPNDSQQIKQDWETKHKRKVKIGQNNEFIVEN